MLAELFKRKYLASLERFALFYDDFAEYGDRDAPLAFYFVPGIDGVPGQVRFALPMLLRTVGAHIYVRSLHLDEFSAKRPIWEKFTPANVDKKRERIVADLDGLAGRHDKLFVMCSSSGFYDFLSAYGELSAAVRERSTLLWVAVAPDHFRSSPWENIFFRINGFVHGGHRWFAAPNHNWLRWVNPETTTSHTWKSGSTRKVFYKNDLESRLDLLGMQWSYNSLGAFNECLAHAIGRSRFPIDIPAFILVATADGYWQGRPQSDIDALLDRYLSRKQVLRRRASHLWVLTPDNMRDLLELARGAARH